MRFTVAPFLLGASLVHFAVGQDNFTAADPLTEDDIGIVSGIDTYQPEQHDCPLNCVDYSNPHSWIPYFSVERLRRCDEPMLLQLSVSQPLDDPDSTVLIRACSVGSQNSTDDTSTGEPMENPKKAKNLFQASLKVSPACEIKGTPIKSKLQLGTSGDETSNKTLVANAVSLLKGMEKFFDARDNCNEKFLFAHYQQTVASIYIGPGLGKPTAKSALDAFAKHIQTMDAVSNYTVAEFCGQGREAEQVFGIAVDTTGNLASVQKATLQWSKGDCTINDDFRVAGHLAGVEVFDLAGNGTLRRNETSSGQEKRSSSLLDHGKHGKRSTLNARATCRYIQIVDGDSCQSLAARCGIRGSDFTKFNPKTNMCSTLKSGDYVCCSAGDPYTPPKPDAPKPNADGTCATHLIDNGDSCDSLAEINGITVKDIENWNQNKTWAWTECKDMLVGYNMCLSPGSAPMPPPQQGAECGPLVPGTKPPADSSTSLADLNPCPLNACCSNWGFCGVFPGHCTVNAPEGGGPGTKKKGFQNTCISNCGNKIKQNSGAPSSFQRIGYYEAYNFGRKCLWMNAKDANTDGSYTHMHWAFASIDPNTWKPVITEGKNEWADFKKLPVKRIVSFGGWADSTEAGKYHIIRSAIIDHRDTFAANLAQFAQDEGIDGIDIDWEYPGAPDILVGGNPIGQKTDGLRYLRFLTVLREKLDSSKSVSIAAPASYWYLKAFPIDKIAEVIDYIVYMTYDLHGQWDYGNPNAFDMCPSGKCIRSHVNLTETRNALAMITKAGVPNNKIYVGEASYGRSFRMAQDGCWGPMCEFTGSKIESNTNPGRCTDTGGYLAYAEILEILLSGDSNARRISDEDSDSDIILYKGDYVSYMTPTTKDKRREEWKGLNFAGSIDWAVDLQLFTKADFDDLPDRPASGEGCIGGTDIGGDTLDLCEFTCTYGFCPESVCECFGTGPLKTLPSENKKANFVADSLDVDVNRLCKFACKYGYCPDQICIPEESETNDDDAVEPVEDEVDAYDYNDARYQNAKKCWIYKEINQGDDNLDTCKIFCKPQLDEAEEEGRISNYGCIGRFPLGEEIPWRKDPFRGKMVAPGECNCDNMLLNELATTVLEAMPVIAQIGCYILMQSFKLILDIGIEFATRGTGKALDAAVDMLATAGQMASYIYPEGENPEDAFSWWLSPCGGTDLVPDEVKQVFDTLGMIPSGKTSFKPPKDIKKGSGKKGDDGNPDNTRGVRKTGGGSKGGNSRSRRKCTTVPPSKRLARFGPQSNTLRFFTCKNDATHTTEYVITTLTYAPNARPSAVTSECKDRWPQACYHYSSAIKENPHWETLTCPPDAAVTNKPRPKPPPAVAAYEREHRSDWRDKSHRTEPTCHGDEFPPLYFLTRQDPEYVFVGINKRGQRIRYLPGTENSGAASLWKSFCFKTPLEALSDTNLQSRITSGNGRTPPTVITPKRDRVSLGITVDIVPEFSMTYEHAANPPRDAGLWDNPCWASGIAAGDPGFALFELDEWYDKNPKGPGGRRTKWNYAQPYVQGQNGD